MEAAYKPRGFEDKKSKIVEEEKQHIPKRRRRRRISKIVVLPESIIHYEILSRLPTKYILRCRLVCKSWYSLFRDPNFVKSHLTRQHDQEEDVVIANKLTYPGIYIISRTQEICVPAVPKLSAFILGCINGLICASSVDGKQQFSLWNPAIAQVKNIFLPSYHPTNKCCTHSVGGFSWDPVRNDYKLVLVCNDYKTFSPNCFLVYSSNSATWTQVPVISTDSDASVFGLNTLLGRKGVTPPSTLVNGIPYWSYSHYLHLPGKKLRRKFITTFKFLAQYNEFRSLPDLDTMKIRGKHFEIVNMKDSLVGMAYKERCQDSHVDIYSLDEESPRGVWSKMYTIGPIDLSYSYWRLSQGFKNGGEILIFKAPIFCFYDPETKETKDIKSECGILLSQFGIYSYWIFSYTPSLVCVQGMELMNQELSMYGDSPP